jgi:hypothetical protein
MNAFKWLLAAAAVGVVLVAFRDLENQQWLAPALPNRGGGVDLDEEEVEPVLGYDGMDADTILEWLSEAELDRVTLTRMRRYEQAHRGREPVLAAIADLL